MSSKSRRLRSVEGLTHRAERRQSHPPDTDSRLLTEMNRSRIAHGRNLDREATSAVVGTAGASVHPRQAELTAFRDQGLIDNGKMALRRFVSSAPLEIGSIIQID